MNRVRFRGMNWQLNRLEYVETEIGPDDPLYPKLTAVYEYPDLVRHDEIVILDFHYAITQSALLDIEERFKGEVSAQIDAMLRSGQMALFLDAAQNMAEQLQQAQESQRRAQEQLTRYRKIARLKAAIVARLYALRRLPAPRLP